MFVCYRCNQSVVGIKCSCKDGIVLVHGDCLEVMAGMEAESVDAVICDPPYGLGFMGKAWDHGVPGVEFWTEALRVAKPGAHLLSFGGTRTFHRLACAVEDAGWEIRDTIAWVYGSGFPKSLDVSKAIDKCNGDGSRLHKFTAWMRTTGVTAKQLDATTGTNMGGHYLTAQSQPAIPTTDLWASIRPLCGNVPAWVDSLVRRIEAEREVVGKHESPTASIYGGGDWTDNVDITAPATDAAKQWEGWGTALKPAMEMISVARKPLGQWVWTGGCNSCEHSVIPGPVTEKYHICDCGAKQIFRAFTVAANVLEHGTGGINVDGCRIGTEVLPEQRAGDAKLGTFIRSDMVTPERVGRFPANLIHDGSEEVLGLFPESKDGVAVNRNKIDGLHSGNKIFGARNVVTADSGFGGSGSAARFFYCVKASRSDGCCDNDHPTVKPTDLMRYLCRLVTPPGGMVLDPFMGSGSTGCAAREERYRFIGIEIEEKYCHIAAGRLGIPPIKDGVKKKGLLY